jgi:uncharacterized SAM-binding protein YcdF (DUF218 family)
LKEFRPPGREALFRALADFWIVSDAVEPADLVVLLGGDPGCRSLAAAQYYRRGLVQRVLISAGHSLAYLRPKIARQIAAVKLGVPESAVRIFGENPMNTNLEAVALQKWILSNATDSVIVPTELFSARRVRWILRRKLAASGTRVIVPALETEYYKLSDYWESDQALNSFKTEFFKYLYYRLRY